MYGESSARGVSEVITSSRIPSEGKCVYDDAISASPAPKVPAAISLISVPAECPKRTTFWNDRAAEFAPDFSWRTICAAIEPYDATVRFQPLGWSELP